jgi:hypothetical protein
MEARWGSSGTESQSKCRAIRPKQQRLRAKSQSRKRSIERKSQSRLSERSTTQSETINYVHEHRAFSSHALIHIPVRIDDVTTYALIDTGASVSAMSKYFFDRLRSNAKLNIVHNDHNNLRSICGSSMDIAGIYDLSISLGDNPESVMQRFYIVPQLTETCILGIDFITNNSMVIDGENRRETCKINDEQFPFIGEPKLSEYNCSALIQKLNAVVAASSDVGINSEHLIQPPNVQARIKDVNSEIYRNMINDLVTKNKDVIANKLCELGKAYGIKHRILREKLYISDHVGRREPI